MKKVTMKEAHAEPSTTCVFCELDNGLHVSDCRLKTGATIAVMKAQIELKDKQNEQLRAQVATLTDQRDAASAAAAALAEKCVKLEEVRAHYADKTNWGGPVGDEYEGHGERGWSVAHDALAGGENDRT